MDALALRVESGEVPLKEVEKILSEWKDLVDESIQKKKQENSISPAVNPEDVFGIRKVK